MFLFLDSEFPRSHVTHVFSFSCDFSEMKFSGADPTFLH